MGQYSQSNELEADRVGVDLMVLAGFNPRGAADMQKKLARLGAGGNSVAQKLLVANQEPYQAVQSALKVCELNPRDPISKLLLYCNAASGDTLNAARAKERARSLVLFL